MTKKIYNYIKNGNEIYKRSFEIIRREAQLDHFPEDIEKIAVRMIHACGRIEIASKIDFSPNVGKIGYDALRKNANILCDSKMVLQGITRSRLPSKNEIFCYLDDPRTLNISKKLKTTRSAAALELWEEKIENSVILIGNAPTALFHLLEMLERKKYRPSLIIGVPVGFVGAAESKEALRQNSLSLPFITVCGREGGSAMAVAALNAIAKKKEI